MGVDQAFLGGRESDSDPAIRRGGANGIPLNRVPPRRVNDGKDAHHFRVTAWFRTARSRSVSEQLPLSWVFPALSIEAKLFGGTQKVRVPPPFRHAPSPSFLPFPTLGRPSSRTGSSLRRGTRWRRWSPRHAA